jgi:hypothetical protein
MLSPQPEGFDMLNTLKQINSTSAFNRWAGIEVTRAVRGEAADSPVVERRLQTSVAGQVIYTF